MRGCGGSGARIGGAGAADVSGMAHVGCCRAATAFVRSAGGLHALQRAAHALGGGGDEALRSYAHDEVVEGGR